MPILELQRPGRSGRAAAAFVELLPGLAVVALVTAAAILLQTTRFFAKVLPLSSLLLAILVGMGLGNSIPLPDSLRPGIRFAAKKVLRLAIIFLGFKLSVGQIAGVGLRAVAVALLGSTTTLFFTLWLGRTMGVPLKRALLLGSGVSICGASAVAAVGGVIGAEEEDSAFAISAITLFGTIAMFLYPVIRILAGLPDLFYALWAGSSIHEVAQVAAASAVIADPVRGIAATVKMIRVLFVIPLTLVLSFMPWSGAGQNGSGRRTRGGGKAGVSVPWFALLFFAAVLVNSFLPMGRTLHEGLVGFDTWIMTAAMAGLGLDIRLASLASIGFKPAALGALSSIFLSLLCAAAILVLHLGR